MFCTYDSPLPIDEWREADFGDISYSESERYKNDSRRTGIFCRLSPEALTPPAESRRCLFGWPLSSTSKLKNTDKERKREEKGKKDKQYYYYNNL